MAIKRSPWALGNRTSVRPIYAGAITQTTFSHTLIEDIAAADILDLGVVPGGCRVHDAILFAEGDFTGITANIGLMSGDPGSVDPARTVGSEFYAAQALPATLTVPARLAKTAPLLLARVDFERSIGLQLSALVTAAATRKLHLTLFYSG